MNIEAFYEQINENSFKSGIRRAVDQYIPSIDGEIEIEQVINDIYLLNVNENVGEVMTMVVLLLRRTSQWKELDNHTFIKQFTKVAQQYMYKDWTFDHLNDVRQALEKTLDDPEL